MTILYNIKYKTNILHSKLTAEEAADKLQDYADKFFEQENDPNAWPFDRHTEAKHINWTVVALNIRPFQTGTGPGKPKQS